MPALVAAHKAALIQSAAAVAAAVPPTFTFVGFNRSATDASSYTFTAQGIGTASADRLVIVSAGARVTTNQTITGITCGGVAMNLTPMTANQAPTLFGYLVVAAGTTADIVVNFSATVLRCNIEVGFLTAYQSATPVTTGESFAPAVSTSWGLDLNHPAGSFGLYGCCKTGSANAPAWSAAVTSISAHQAASAESMQLGIASHSSTAAEPAYAVRCTSDTAIPATMVGAVWQ